MSRKFVLFDQLKRAINNIGELMALFISNFQSEFKRVDADVANNKNNIDTLNNNINTVSGAVNTLSENSILKNNTTAYTPSSSYNPATKKYVDDGDSSLSSTISSVSSRVTTLEGNVLKKNNTTSFTPSGNYNPATKKYVDDNISYVEEVIDGVNRKATENATTLSGLSDEYLSKSNTSDYTPTGNYNPATKKYVDDSITSNTLKKTNTTSYTPTSSYHPSTKKYVDDSITNLKTLILDTVFPIGSIYTTIINLNPSNTIGGTWVQVGSGRTLVGQGTGYDTNRDSRLFLQAESGGEYNHKLTVSEMPSHSHQTPHAGGPTAQSSSPFAENKPMLRNPSSAYGTETTTSGGGSSHNNVQPYLTVYFWQRIDPATRYNTSSDWEQGSFSDATATGSTYANGKSSNTTRLRKKTLISVSGKTSITIQPLNPNLQVYGWWFDSNQKYTGQHFTYWSNGSTFDIPSGASYVLIALRYYAQGTIYSSGIGNGILVY